MIISSEKRIEVYVIWLFCIRQGIDIILTDTKYLENVVNEEYKRKEQNLYVMSQKGRELKMKTIG